MVISTDSTAVMRRVSEVHDPQVVNDAPNHLARQAIAPGDWERRDPFLLMMEDRFGQGAFGPHPHRGMETITYIIDGHLDHSDNRGHSGRLGPRDVQLMTAGRGIVHNEVPAPGVMVHSLQLWLNLPAADKLTQPRYQDLRHDQMPTIVADGVTITVYAGRFGDVSAPTMQHTPFQLAEVDLVAGAAVDVELVPSYNGFVHVVAGGGWVGPDRIPAVEGQTLWLERTDAANVARVGADSAMRVIVAAGRPLAEPVVSYGPFVMNTQEQILEAFEDYRAGRFEP